MALTRRDFLGGASAAAAITTLHPGMLRASEGLPLRGADTDPTDPTAPIAALGVSRPSTIDDPLGVRDDFPVVLEGVYLDSAYITPSPVSAVDAAQSFLAMKARNPMSLGRMLEETNIVRERFATLVGATEREIGVLYATSDGENVVARALDLGPGDNVVVDDLHYETTYLLYQELAERRGLEVRIVRSEAGAAGAEAFADMVDDRTKLISVAWVSHQNGYVHDLGALADLAHAHGAHLYADAIQGVGAVDLDVRETGIDFFTTGTYKWLLGGYGVAPFYVREELLDLIEPDRFGSLSIADDLGDHRFRIYDDARKYGYATMGFGAVFQLRAALDYLLDVGVPNIERHTTSLAGRLNTGLRGQGHDVWTPEGNRSSIVTFRHHRNVAAVRRALTDAGIRVSYKAEGEELRIGIGLFNNSDEVDRLLEVTGGW